MEDLRFLLDFSDKGSIDKIINGLTSVEGKFEDVKKSAIEFEKAISKASTKLSQSNSSKDISAQITNIDKLKNQYTSLQQTIDKAQKANEKQRLDEIKLQKAREKAFDDYEKKVVAGQKANEKQRLDEIKLQKAREKAFDDYEKKVVAGQKAIAKEQEKQNKIVQKSIDEQIKAEKKLEAEKRKQFLATEEGIRQTQLDAQKRNELIAKVREQIKDETALALAQKKEIKSLNDLQAQTNAMVRLRNKLDITTKEGKKDFDNYTRAIAKNTETLKANDASIGRHQRNVGNYKSAFQGIGTKLGALTGISLGLTAIGSSVSSAVESFQQFDASLKEVSAITGLTGTDLEFFKQKALGAADAYGITADKYLEAIKLIGSAKPELLSNKEALDKVTQSAVTLSQASGLELPDAAKSLTDAMNQFGASAEEADRFINALAAGSKFGAAEVPQVTEALLKFGVAAKSSNISIEESTALIETLAEKGLKGADAGTALRNVLAKLSAPSTLPKEAIKALDKAGVNLQVLSDTTIPVSKRLDELAKIQGNAAAITKVFGLENKNAAQILIEQRKRFEELTTQVTGTNTAYEQAATQNQSAAYESEVLNARLNTMAITIGEKLTPVVNFFKKVLIKLLEVINAIADGLGWFFEKIGDAARWLRDLTDPVSILINAQNELIDANNRQVDSMNNANKAVDRLRDSFGHKLASRINASTKTLEEYNYIITAVDASMQLLSKATLKTQEEGKALANAYADGKITLDEFRNSAYELYKLEQVRSRSETIVQGAIKDAQKRLEIQKEENKAKEEENAKLAKLAKEQRDKEYDDLLKQIEREKTLEETAIERSVNDEEEKAKKKEYVEYEFLKKKLVLDKEFSKDFEKTEFDLVTKKIAIRKLEEEERKKELERQLAIQKEYDDLELRNVKDDFEKRKIEEMRAFDEKILQLEQNNQLTADLEIRLRKELAEKINAINKEQRAKALEDELAEYDEYYKERELMDLKSGKTTEQIEALLRKDKIDHLKDEIELRKEAGQETLDLEIELAREELAIQKDKEEKKKKILQDSIQLTKESIQAITNAYQEALEKKIQRDQREIDMQQDNIRRQEELAQNGQQNTLAFEKQIAAEKEKQLLIDQKKQQRAKEVETFFNALAEYSKQDPNTAPAKAFLQVQLAKLFASRFEEGGIVGDVVNRKGAGGSIINSIFKGNSHKQGGIMIEAEGEEGILSKKEMRKLGKTNFYALKNALRTPNAGIDLQKQNESLNATTIINKQIDLSPLKEEIKQVKEAIQQKPVASFQVDALLNAITTIKSGKQTRKIISLRKGFNK